MLGRTAQHDVPTKCPGFAGSRKDFVRALRALGKSVVLGGRALRQTRRDSTRVLLSCSREEWLRTFGKEHLIISYCDGAGRVTCDTWQYHCLDGVVLCVGHRHGGVDGNAWMTLEGLYFL